MTSLHTYADLLAIAKRRSAPRGISFGTTSDGLSIVMDGLRAVYGRTPSDALRAMIADLWPEELESFAPTSPPAAEQHLDVMVSLAGYLADAWDGPDTPFVDLGCAVKDGRLIWRATTPYRACIASTALDAITALNHKTIADHVVPAAPDSAPAAAPASPAPTEALDATDEAILGAFSRRIVEAHVGEQVAVEYPVCEAMDRQAARTRIEKRLDDLSAAVKGFCDDFRKVYIP